MIVKISKYLLVLTAVFCISGCGASGEEIELASKSCEDFIQKEFEDNTHVFDVWEKDEKIVVEVGYNEYDWQEKYSVRLCVVDLKNGRISIPSIFNMSDWGK